jgi:hypothetical protein
MRDWTNILEEIEQKRSEELRNKKPPSGWPIVLAGMFFGIAIFACGMAFALYMRP